MVFGDEVRKMLLEAAAIIGIAGCCRETGSRTDEYGIGLLQRVFQLWQVNGCW